MLKQLPNDINIEDLLLYLPENSYKVSIDGLHKRNSYFDIVDMEKDDIDGKTIFHIGRSSIYNSLPEFMFHAINRFDNIPDYEHKERFTEEYDKQKQEKQNAHRFFATIDTFLLSIRLQAKQKLYEYVEGNKILEEIIGDTLSDEEKQNRFIKKAIPFLPQCKVIRGNRTLLTLMLRKIFLDEGITLLEEKKSCKLTDNNPQYKERLDNVLEEVYLGNEYYDNITTFHIHYWSEEECNANFMEAINDLECFRKFVMNYFLSIEDSIEFHVVTDAPPLRLSDTIVYNYLNFNTNI